MINFNMTISVAKTTGSALQSTTANNAVAAKGFKAYAQAMPVATCHKLSKRDLAYFSSEKFVKALEALLLKREYSSLIEARSWTDFASRREARLTQLCDELLDEAVAAIYDGLPHSYEGVKTYCLGLRSQAIREAKQSKGFNAAMYWEFSRLLKDNKTVRRLLKRLNRPVIKKAPRL